MPLWSASRVRLLQAQLLLSHGLFNLTPGAYQQTKPYGKYGGHPNGTPQILADIRIISARPPSPRLYFQPKQTQSETEQVMPRRSVLARKLLMC